MTEIFSYKNLVHKNLLGKTSQEEDDRLSHDLISWRESLVFFVQEIERRMIEANTIALSKGNGRYAKADLAETKKGLVELKMKASTTLRHVKGLISESNRAGNPGYQELQLRELREIKELLKALYEKTPVDFRQPG